ncbi:MAG: AAA family ATPase, partial [Actinobacteria bacterium]|nr:AAA family ATPase [Actinomycetota bacterium]
AKRAGQAAWEARNGKNGIEDLCAADVTPEPVEWLWAGRIPYGKLTIFDGDPDKGKSMITVDIAARVTTGRGFPDGAPCEPGNVLIVNVEDGAADTIVPRLIAAGADLTRVFIFSGVPDGKGGTRLLELPADIGLLKDKVKERGADLVILDPVITMLGGDANKDQDARKSLAPVRDMAEATGAAVVGVRHLNKTVGLRAIQRGGGNMGLIGVARAGAFFAEHPEDDSLRVMAQHKSNLAQKPPSLAYKIVTSAINEAARVEWAGVVEHDADSLAASGGTPHEKTELDSAKEFLRDELSDGPVWAKQVFKDAKDAGVAEITLRRAKSALHVKSERQGTEGWAWALPSKDDHQPPSKDDHQPPPEGDRSPNSDHVDHVDHLPPTDKQGDEYSPYVKEGDHGDQDDHGDHARLDDHDHDHVPSGLRVDDPGPEDSRRKLTLEETRLVKRLVGDGMAYELACAEVLGGEEETF